MRTGVVFERWRWVGSAYLLVQGAGVVVFWVWLMTRAGARELFVPVGVPGRAFMVFAGADLGVLAVTSIAAGVGVWRGAEWARMALAVHVGAAVYAGLCAVGLWALDRSLWLGVVMMLPVMIVPPWLLWSGREGRA